MKYVFKCPDGHVFEEKMPVADYVETGGFVLCWICDPETIAEIQVQPVPFVWCINNVEQRVTREMIGEGNLGKV